MVEEIPVEKPESAGGNPSLQYLNAVQEAHWMANLARQSAIEEAVKAARAKAEAEVAAAFAAKEKADEDARLKSVADSTSAVTKAAEAQTAEIAAASITKPAKPKGK